MHHRHVLGLIGIAIAPILLFGSDTPQDPPTRESGLVEHVEVRLVILDVVVLDPSGNPVSGLDAKDFDVEVDGRSVPLQGFESSCDETARKPNIALVFDYQHLDEAERGRILDEARSAVDRGAANGTTVMVAALTGGLRVEQLFTRDLGRVRATLGRMRNDVSLWAGDFSHKSEDGLVRGLSSLFDVAGTYAGPTAVIFYSGLKGAPLEEQFRQLSAQAAAARCVVYPVDVDGLSTGPPILDGIKPAIRGDTLSAPPLALSGDEGGTASAAAPRDPRGDSRRVRPVMPQCG